MPVENKMFGVRQLGVDNSGLDNKGPDIRRLNLTILHAKYQKLEGIFGVPRIADAHDAHCNHFTFKS